MKRGFNACQSIAACTHQSSAVYHAVIQAVSSKVHHFNTFFAHFGLPWDNRGNCYINRKRIQCLSNASQHVPIYLNRFWDIGIASYWSKIATFSDHTSIYRPRRGWPRWNFAKILIYTKLEWMGYREVKKAWQYVQPFWYSTSVWRTDRRTDVQPIHLLTCFSIADALKNKMNEWMNDVFINVW